MIKGMNTIRAESIYKNYLSWELIPSDAYEKYRPILMNWNAKLRHVYEIHIIFSIGMGITFLIFAGILSDNDEESL